MLAQAGERLEYLLSEYYATLPTDQSIETELRLNAFIKDFPKSTYRGRVQYLLGHHFLLNSKFKEAEEILKKTVGDNDVSNYIRELAKTELSDLILRKRSL